MPDDYPDQLTEWEEVERGVFVSWDVRGQEVRVVQPATTKQEAAAAWIATLNALSKLAEETRKKKWTLVMEDGCLRWEEMTKLEEAKEPPLPGGQAT